MKFSMSEAWRDATTMMSANREVLLIVAALFFLVPSLVMALVMPGMQEMMMADPENASNVVLEIYAGWWWLVLLVMLAQVVGYLALLALLRDTSRPTVGEALRAGLAGLLPAIGFYLLLMLGFTVLTFVVVAASAGSVALGVVLGLILAVVAVYVMVKMCLALAVIAIDKVSNPVAAMSRSWQLTKGNSFRLFLFFVLLAIVYMVISMVVAMVIGALLVALGTSTALWVNGALDYAHNFKNHRIIAQGPIRVVFEVDYEPWGPKGMRVAETKRISLDAGRNLNKSTSVFRALDGATDITYATGTVKRAGLIGSASRANRWAWLAGWGPVLLKGGGHGELGTAVMLPRGLAIGRGLRRNASIGLRFGVCSISRSTIS